jgi:glycerol-3-phosphate acyltransferase PlsY
MRSVAWAAGFSVVLAYLLGSIPFGYLLTRRRLRHDLRRIDDGAPLDVQLHSVLTGDAERGWHVDDLTGAVLDTAKVLLGATIAWHLVQRAAPGFDRSLLPQVSAVGFLADQVLTSWQSAALWAGLAAVVGHLASPWLGFRTGQGQAPALALVFVYCPYGFSFAVLLFFIALAVLRDVPRAVLVSLPGVVAFAWLAWIYDWRTAWGATNGPELALWAAVLASVIGARTIALTRTLPVAG